MKVEVVKVERLYNLGDYESLRVGYEAALTELEGASSQEVLKVTASLEKLCDEYFQAGRFQKQSPAKAEKPQPKPSEKQLSFEEKELLGHEGWKGRKIDNGEYEAGSLGWGWDFANNFSGETVAWLGKTARIVDGHEFSLAAEGRIVSVKKVKQK